MAGILAMVRDLPQGQAGQVAGGNAQRIFGI
jgi:hypothetical protein